ncbi:uncharacterized protein BJ171DRAFT_577081 [Polychytrium aggregatum]|uniref:uncharacterized protein n=1 Tax=Polychytrium aggregatum TaxID=110093 RepID=UPI0022FEAA68|nr:uncharacterized protein BJ171DRAFT_577081 [Polychytrium aggregatum]KAI9209466.1 hypothetical protein BJ171DRAFT_577081 [Polychytrium aggregatum]
MDPTLSNAADIVDLVYATVWTVIFTLAALLVLSYLVGEAIRSACRPAKAGSLLLILFAAVVRAVVPLRPTTIPDIVATNVFYSLYPLFFSQISLLIVVWMDWLLYFQTSPAVGRQRTVFWRRIGLIAVILAYFAAACVLGQYSLASDIPVVDVKFIYYSLGLSVFLLPLYMNYGLKVRRALRKALAAGNPHPYGKANLEHDICKACRSMLC